MAYKQAGVSKIYDSSSPNGSLVNMTDGFGNYSDLCPNDVSTMSLSGATATLNFYNPWQSISMSQNLTFNESNKNAGRATIFGLRTNTYTPTFSSNILWANGSEPNWSSSSFWEIGMQCIDGALVIASAQPTTTG
jgi:hypothetical protein